MCSNIIYAIAVCLTTNVTMVLPPADVDHPHPRAMHVTKMSILKHSTCHVHMMYAIQALCMFTVS